MKLLVAAQNWPHRGHTRLSANIVVFELIRAFAAARDCAVAFVCTPRADWGKWQIHQSDLLSYHHIELWSLLLYGERLDGH